MHQDRLYLASDQKYETRENRETIKGLGIQTSFKPLGQKSKEIQKTDPWFKVKQKREESGRRSVREREGTLGLDRVKCTGVESPEMWRRAGFLRST